MESYRTDRIIGLILLITALCYGYYALKLEVSDIMDPVGPKAFPLLLAGGLAALSLIMMIKPKGIAVTWPAPKIWLMIGMTVGALALYAFLLVPLGFVLATTLVMTALAAVFHGPLARSALVSLAFSSALFCLFDTLLGLNIPTGQIFSFLGR